MIDFIVTGTGRSTTKYTAEVLTAAGLPCSHETVCASWTDEYGDDGLWRQAFGGESSWQAAPFLSAMQAEGVKVIHLVRHPVLVASSMVSNRMLVPEPDGSLLPWHEFIVEHLGNRIWRMHPHDRALQFWIEWNRMIGETPDLRWFAPVALPDVDDLAYLLGRRIDLSATASIPKQVNHWREVERLKRRDFTRVIWDEAMDLWRSYC